MTSFTRNLLTLCVTFAVFTPKTEAQAKVWDWPGNCDSPQQTRLSVEYRGRVVYKHLLRVCYVLEKSVHSSQPRLAFRFRADEHDIDPERPHRTVLVEGNIWEAGSDPTDVLFGFSLTTEDQILLNSIHIAQAKRLSRIPQAKHLVVTTTAFRP